MGRFYMMKVQRDSVFSGVIAVWWWGEEEQEGGIAW